MRPVSSIRQAAGTLEDSRIPLLGGKRTLIKSQVRPEAARSKCAIDPLAIYLAGLRSVPLFEQPVTYLLIGEKSQRIV